MSLQKHLESAQALEDSSKDSSDESSEDVSGHGDCDELIQRVFGNYNGTGGPDDLRTREALVQSIGSGSCLICISAVKRKDAIWSCDECHCVLHLQCIQRWARDSIYQQKRDLEHENPDLSRGQQVKKHQDFKQVYQWGCPKCRSTYDESHIPDKYTCYCGQVTDPSFDPWLVPHSCGETCGKPLKPDCGHSCLILCHPGPCPPCPKVVKAQCFCNNTAPATKRCFDKKWSCGKPCQRQLNCGQHTCPIPCHEGDTCPPCDKKSVQLCLCHRNQKLCDCCEPQWQCLEKCGKKLDCGFHVCEVICHAGQCPPCPLSQVRHCPCGKNTYKLPCTVATPTCGDSCGKTLACGNHVCVERCHRGSCGSCLQMLVKKCKCGAKKKEVACTKDYTCEFKCKNMKDCKKHACNRKCCTSCPPCDQICNKTMACKNHKCNSRCHRGSCYPCTLTQEVSCFCKASRLLVPCGLEKATKPPKCKQKCRNSSDCHHPKRTSHACHFGACPTCKQICGETMSCGHTCPVPCHDQVLMKVDQNNGKVKAPWENKGPTTEIKNLDCPPCEFPVPVTCLGGHETGDWQCYLAKSSACGRSCGRQLSCGNHTCSRDCHKVKNAPDEIQAGANCRKCESECLKSRPEGCNHACLKPCHPEPCDPCGQMIRIKCNCGITQLYVKCGQWIDASPEEKISLACCQDQCPKLMPCGHRCSLICHLGQCSDESLCKKKVKNYCPCKRRKVEMQCGKSQKIHCDEECKKQKEKVKVFLPFSGKSLFKNHATLHCFNSALWRLFSIQVRAQVEEEKQRQKLETERLQREEAERFEAKNDGRNARRNRQRQRRNMSESQDSSFLSKFKLPLLVFVLSFTAAMLAVYLYK